MTERKVRCPIRSGMTKKERACLGLFYNRIVAEVIVFLNNAKKIVYLRLGIAPLV